MDPRAAFDKFTDGKPFLDIDDLSCAVWAVFGIKFKKQDLRDLMSQYCKQESQGIGLEAFLALVEERRRIFGERDRALRLFSALDKHDNGFLDLRSFHEVCAETCRPAAARATEIFHDMDRSKAHPLQELADVRQRHHQRFREREEQAAEEQRRRELLQQEEQDAVLAEQFAKEEEEARLRQLEADEEYSRQLAAHLNPGGSHPLQEFRGQSADNSMAEDAELAHYQQLEDSEAEGYRAPMRTGYVERLIDTPQDLSWAWAMLQGQGDSAREPMVSGQEEATPLVASRGQLCLRIAVPALAGVSLAVFIYWSGTSGN
ncbi:EFCAB11 [Symbiodinium natans]|uniref:EFCAB11 protein n=1 Tax=Symbiodinium natans TaxID=878477 RepID=A0A812TFY6_9DINO|nr:EFCAB11 [Symbiodinium natans]